MPVYPAEGMRTGGLDPGSNSSQLAKPGMLAVKEAFVFLVYPGSELTWLTLHLAWGEVHAFGWLSDSPASRPPSCAGTPGETSPSAQAGALLFHAPCCTWAQGRIVT